MKEYDDVVLSIDLFDEKVRAMWLLLMIDDSAVVMMGGGGSSL